VLEHGGFAIISIGSNLSDVTGSAWGCGAANSRMTERRDRQVIKAGDRPAKSPIPQCWVR
jgi:hypothetical protein